MNWFVTSPPIGGGRGIVMPMSVCLSVCVFVRVFAKFQSVISQPFLNRSRWNLVHTLVARRARSAISDCLVLRAIHQIVFIYIYIMPTSIIHVLWPCYIPVLSRSSHRLLLYVHAVQVYCYLLKHTVMGIIITRNAFKKRQGWLCFRSPLWTLVLKDKWGQYWLNLGRKCYMTNYM